MGIFSGNFYSETLAMTTRIQVIFPDLSNDVTPVITGTPRVLYLLHGLGGDCEEWTRFSKIEYYAKKYNFIIILPEVQRSFYCDTSYGPRYFTYIADELPEICSRWFRLDESRETTFIAGESMGGYGAMKAALSRPQRFAAAASLSGALDYVATTAPRRAILLHFEKRLAELHGLYSPAESPHHALLRHFQHLPAGRNELLESLPA